jgi:DNA repair protein RecO (recombination protein O)
MLSAACAVAEGALPEREPHPRVFHGLVHLLARLPRGAAMLSDLVRWELTLLSDLGYGLDLTVCAVTGETTGLAFVSPRSGRAVTNAAAGIWKQRLLPLPGFLTNDAAAASAANWRDGLALTFGTQHRPLPAARQMLYDLVAALADDSESLNAG